MEGLPRSQDQARPVLRTDAEQNRIRILDAARAALIETHDASLNAIAKRAGVGPGTLYRHFPSREALLLAVYRHDVEDLVEAAPALLTTYPPPDALRLWFERLAAYGRVKHGLSGAFSAATSADLSGEYYSQVVGAIRLLLQAGQSAGVLRADVDAEEVLLLVGFLWRIDAADWERRSQHMLDLVLDGLKRHPR